MKQRQSIRKKLNKVWKNNLTRKKMFKAIIGIVFVVVTIFLAAVIRLQIIQNENTIRSLSDAREEEVILQEQLESSEQALLESTKKYVDEVGVKPCVILCFDDFSDSAYGGIIEAMDKYGFKGVIVFRDGDVPGAEGAISIELYQDLLAKGWEGAIGNSESIRVYNNFPEVRRQEWFEYVEKMQEAFRNKGLEEPTVYIPHENEILTGILDLLTKYNLRSYTRMEKYFENAATEISTNQFLEIGMVVGKYDYDTLSSDIISLVPTAESVAVLFKKVQNGAPTNKEYTSMYVLDEQLERLSMLGEFINVTTFSGYREYQQNIVAHNELIYKNYLVEQSSIRNQIASLKAQIAENYAKIFDSE